MALIDKYLVINKCDDNIMKVILPECLATTVISLPFIEKDLAV